MSGPVEILSAEGIAAAREILELRAEVRAYLEYQYVFEYLADAVDPLQEYAERSGLVAAIGQDAVQAIIAAPFARYRERVAAEIRAALPPDLEELPIATKSSRQDYRPAQSTIDAFWHVVRTEPAAAIAEWLAIHPRDASFLHGLWKKKCSIAPAK